MEVILFITGALIAYIFALILLFIDSKNEKEYAHALAVMCLFVGIFMMCAGCTINAKKHALDNNPYTKEYLYKVSPDGSMEKYDSVYVKKPKL